MRKWLNLGPKARSAAVSLPNGWFELISFSFGNPESPWSSPSPFPHREIPRIKDAFFTVSSDDVNVAVLYNLARLGLDLGRVTLNLLTEEPSSDGPSAEGTQWVFKDAIFVSVSRGDPFAYDFILNIDGMERFSLYRWGKSNEGWMKAPL